MKKKIILFAFLAAFTCNGLFAQLAGYSYIKSITVSNTASVNAVDYQLKLTVNTQSLVSAAQMLASGDDIRFGKTCTGSTLYNYWIESGMNTPTTSIWVKIDTIPANGTRTIYMYHGNSSATAASSIPLTFSFAGSSTDSVANGSAGGVANSQRGFRFSPNVDILVTSLGKNEPTGTTRYITLFDNATQTIVTQQQVGGAAGVYTYSNLASPIWLTQNTQYLLQLFQGASDGYYYGSSSQIDSRLTYYDMRYCNSCTQNTFPTNVLTAFHYGYPDLLFYFRNMVTPAPTYSFSTSLFSLSVSGPTTSLCEGTNVVLTASGASTYTWNTGANSSSISVTPSVSTVYTVTATLNACSDMQTFSVSIDPSPAVTVNSGSICTGQSFTIMPSGASTYTIQGGSAVVSPTTTSSYSVVGTGTNGCVSANPAISSVTVNTLPSVSVASSSTVICSGQSATLTASGANSYLWNNSSTLTAIAVSPTTTTSYTVTGTSAAGCSQDAVISQSVSACTGIQSQGMNDANVNVYPNPASDEITIILQGIALPVQLEIVNAVGEIVLKQILNDQANTIQINSLSNGLYFVKAGQLIKPLKVVK